MQRFKSSEAGMEATIRPRDHPGVVPSAVGVQPGIQHPDRIIETVQVADGHKLPAGDRARGGHRVERGEGELRLG